MSLFCNELCVGGLMSVVCRLQGPGVGAGPGGAGPVPALLAHIHAGAGKGREGAWAGWVGEWREGGRLSWLTHWTGLVECSCLRAACSPLYWLMIAPLCCSVLSLSLCLSRLFALVDWSAHSRYSSLLTRSVQGVLGEFLQSQKAEIASVTQEQASKQASKQHSSLICGLCS